MTDESIQSLFREMRGEDESLAPPFDRISRTGLRRHSASNRVLITVAAVSLVVLIVSLMVVVLIREWRPNGRETELAGIPQQEASPDVPTPSVVSSTPSELGTVVKDQARRPLRVRSRPPAILISQWRSPTELLLKTPGDDILKTVPRVGASSVDIKTISPDQLN